MFHPAVDWLLRLSRGDRREALRRVRRAVDRFPEIDVGDRAAFMRGIAVRDVVNRIIFRAHNAFPRASVAIARLVPFVGAPWLISRAPVDRPLIVGLMHFGPPHFAITVTLRLLRKRGAVYVFHAGGDTGVASARYLGAIGCVPVLSGRSGFPTVETALRDDPSCAVILCYDHLGAGGRCFLPFLGTPIAFPNGLGRLANSTNAAVVTGWWEWSVRGPRIRIDRRLEIDRRLPDAAAIDDLTARSIRVLEDHVRAAPRDWTEWINCYDGAS